jgi:hypothetical protein
MLVSAPIIEDGFSQSSTGIPALKHDINGQYQ